MSASQPVGRPGSWGGGVPLLFFLLIGVCSESEQSPIVCSRYSSSPLPWLLFSVFRVKALGDVVLVQHGGLGPAQQMPEVEEVLGDVRQLGGASLARHPDLVGVAVDLFELFPGRPHALPGGGEVDTLTHAPAPPVRVSRTGVTVIDHWAPLPLVLVFVP